MKTNEAANYINSVIEGYHASLTNHGTSVMEANQFRHIAKIALSTLLKSTPEATSEKKSHKDVTETYKGPFEYDPWSQSIECPNNPHLIAQFDSEMKDPNSTRVLSIRGWGGLHTTFGQTQGAKIQDAFGKRVAELLNEHGVGDEVTQLITGSKS